MAVKKKSSKPAAKKATAKKAVAKAKSSKKAAKPAKKVAKAKSAKVTKSAKVAKPAAKLMKRDTSPVKKGYSKSQVATEIAGLVGISKKQAGEVMAEMGHIIKRHIGKGGVGSFNMPGLLKITTVHKKATPKRNGINPFTGEATVFKAKPARTVVKVRALKGLKDMV